MQVKEKIIQQDVDENAKDEMLTAATTQIVDEKTKQLNEQIQVQIKEEQDKAVKIQKELNDQLEIEKQDVIRAQNELEQARREAEAAARRGGGGIFGSICRFVVGVATAAWLL